MGRQEGSVPVKREGQIVSLKNGDVCENKTATSLQHVSPLEKKGLWKEGGDTPTALKRDTSPLPRKINVEGAV